jgi:hypothetical protein
LAATKVALDKKTLEYEETSSKLKAKIAEY